MKTWQTSRVEAMPLQLVGSDTVAPSCEAKLRLSALWAGATSKTIIPLSEAAGLSRETAPSFYCVHSLSGRAAADFTDLALALGERARCFAIQAPRKLMIDCDNIGSLPALADYYANCIEEFQPDGPIHLGGWSAGAPIALEIAKRLKARGRDVGVLAAIDGSPDKSRPSKLALSYLMDVLRNLPLALLHTNYKVVWVKIPVVLSMAVEKYRTKKSQGGSRHPIERAYVDLDKFPGYQLHFMKWLYELIEGHEFTGYAGEVVVYKAQISPLLLNGVKAFWKQVAPHGHIVTVPGTHNNLVYLPHVRSTAEDLGRRLERYSLKG